jgi:hypothetical protein
MLHTVCFRRDAGQLKCRMWVLDPVQSHVQQVVVSSVCSDG